VATFKAIVIDKTEAGQTIGLSDFDESNLVRVKRCLGGIRSRIAIGTSSFDAWVVAIGTRGDSFFANFSNETSMTSPGATRGGKTKPFPGAGG